MAEYIERKAFIETVKDIPMWGSVAAMFADSIPAADVAPVVHGRWEKRFCHPMRNGEWQYICSVCKDTDYWNKNVCVQKHNYCPNCGAKMDGGTKDETNQCR